MSQAVCGSLFLQCIEPEEFVSFYSDEEQVGLCDEACLSASSAGWSCRMLSEILYCIALFYLDLCDSVWYCPLLLLLLC